MYIPEKFKINRFQDVRLPKPKDFFLRTGYQSGNKGGMTGDEEPDFDGRKLHQIELGEQYDRTMQKEYDERQNK